jgi:hypothetical protein
MGSAMRQCDMRRLLASLFYTLAFCAVVLWSSVSAHADCLQKGGDKGSLSGAEFFPDTYDSRTFLWYVSGPDACVIRIFLPEGYDLIQTTVTKWPSRGNIRQVGESIFEYKRDDHFQGMDSYSVRVCARKRYGSQGCSTLNYNLNVLK